MFKYIIHSLLRLSTRFLPVKILICAYLIQSLISLLPPERSGRALGQTCSLRWVKANGHERGAGEGAVAPQGQPGQRRSKPLSSACCASAYKKVTTTVSEFCFK